MRLLWARVGVPYSPATGLPIVSQTISQMVDRVMTMPEGARLYLLAPIARRRKGEYRKEFLDFQKRGFQRVADLTGAMINDPIAETFTAAAAPVGQGHKTFVPVG